MRLSQWQIHARHHETEVKPRFDTKGEAQVHGLIQLSSTRSSIEKIHQILEKMNKWKLPK
jgi:hypothetical protein